MLTSQFLVFPIIAFPVLLMVGIVLIPLVANYSDHALAEKAARQTRRWFWGHLLSAAAFALGALAIFSGSLFLIAEAVLFWPVAAMVLSVIGACLLAAGMGADGIGPVALIQEGQSAQLFFDGSRPWVMGIFIAGSIIFSLGQIGMIIGLQHTDLLNTAVGVFMLVAAIIFSVSSAIPSGWGLYVLGITAVAIYLPLGWAFWQVGVSVSIQ